MRALSAEPPSEGRSEEEEEEREFVCANEIRTEEKCDPAMCLSTKKV